MAGVGVELDFAGLASVLFGAHFDGVADAGHASSCLRKLLGLSFGAGVTFAVAEVLGWDWTPSSGEMSSKGCFLKGWGCWISFNGSRLPRKTSISMFLYRRCGELMLHIRTANSMALECMRSSRQCSNCPEWKLGLTSRSARAATGQRLFRM